MGRGKSQTRLYLMKNVYRNKIAEHNTLHLFRVTYLSGMEKQFFPCSSFHLQYHYLGRQEVIE